MNSSSAVGQSTTSTKAGRGMRKGTRSCLECRKRKVKCVFGDDDNVVCVSCKARGSKCAEQRKTLDARSAAAAHKVTLEERVAQLEALIRSGGGSVAGGSGSDRAASESSPGMHHEETLPLRSALGSPESYAGSSSSRLEAPHASDPVTSLFDNAIWRQNPSDREPVPSLKPPTATTGAANQRNKCARTCAALLADLPPPSTLADILNVTCGWWNTWRTGGSWLQESMAKRNIRSLQDFMAWTLNSGDPAVTAMGMLALSTSLQQLDAKIHHHVLVQLPHLPGELFQEYYDRVERLVINDIDFSTTRAGIEVLMMAGKTFMNLGLIKRTWLFLHKAISHAQLLGLHRPQRASPTETDAEWASRQETWFSLCEKDTYTSLLLGLPYATDGRTLSANFQGAPGSLRSFQYCLIKLSVQIIDRNQVGLGCSVGLTQDIQRQTHHATSQLDPEFWDAPAALHQGRISRPEYMERLAAQFFYFQMTVLLHQPLMIESIEEPRFNENRELCLQACRNVLKTYHLMRSDSGKAFSMVKLVDYQAFISSALLLLGLLGYGNPESLSQSIDQDKDWDIVQTTLGILRQASATTNNSVATQAVQGIDTLSALVRAGKTGKCTMSPEQCKNPYAKIVVPGSGTITILPGDFLKKTIVIPSAEPATILPTPIFHLSHGLFQPLADEHQQQYGGMAPVANSSVSDDFNNQMMAVPPDFEIPYMDFDWTNMIDMNTADDWAWLAELSGTGADGGMMV